MKPIGLFMNEHRRIEKVIDILKLELNHQQRTQKPNTGILLTSIDFFKTYADFTHHGKEENILFEKLQEKDLSKDHETILQQLLDDHKQARLLVNQLQQQIEAYRKGDENVIRNMSNTIQKLTILYTDHIEKEDQSFFKPVMDSYLSEKEQKELLDAFYTFDKDAIHKKYDHIIDRLEEM